MMKISSVKLEKCLISKILQIFAKIQFVYKFSSQSVTFSGPYFDFFGLSSQNKKTPLSDSSKTAKTEAKKLDKTTLKDPKESKRFFPE